MALSTRNTTHRGSHNRRVARGQSNHAGPSDWLVVSLVPALFKEYMWTRTEEVTAGSLKPEEFSNGSSQPLFMTEILFQLCH